MLDVSSEEAGALAARGMPLAFLPVLTDGARVISNGRLFGEAPPQGARPVSDLLMAGSLKVSAPPAASTERPSQTS